MNTNRVAGRKAAGLVLALGLVSAAAACGDDGSSSSSSDGGSTKVDFGYIADYSGSAALAAADKQGLWDKAGIDPEMKVFTNGPLQVQALGAGDLDFGYLGPGALWLPASGKASIVGVNMLGKADRVVARPDAGIDEPADLEGKKVAVAEGTSGEMILNLALDEAGLSPDDVEKIPMDPATVVSAVSSGQVEAAAIWYPLVDTMKKKIPDLKEISENTDFEPELAFPSVFVAQPQLAEEDPETVKKVAGVLKEAGAWVAANPEESEKVSAEFLDLPADQVAGSTEHVEIVPPAELGKLTKDGTVAGWFDGLADLSKEMGTLPEPLKAEDYYLADVYTSAGGTK